MDREIPLDPMLGALLRLPLRELNMRVAADLAAAGFVDLRLAHLAVFQHLAAGGARLSHLGAQAQKTEHGGGGGASARGLEGGGEHRVGGGRGKRSRGRWGGSGAPANGPAPTARRSPR